MKSLWILLIVWLPVSSLTAQKVVVKSRNAKQVQASSAQPSYSMKQLNGRWQEYRRTALHGGPVDFTDSLQLNFNKRDSVYVRDGIRMSQRGHAGINGNTLAIAGDNYSIVSLNSNKLIVNDGDYEREFSRRNRFHYENLGKIRIPKENLSEPVSVDLEKLNGKWHVYRTQFLPGQVEDSALLKVLSFTPVPGTAMKLMGDVTFVKNGRTHTENFQANTSKGALTIHGRTQSWQLLTYKADGHEFIFGNPGGLVYFSKKL